MITVQNLKKLGQTRIQRLSLLPKPLFYLRPQLDDVFLTIDQGPHKTSDLIQVYMRYLGFVQKFLRYPVKHTFVFYIQSDNSLLIRQTI